MARRHPLKHDTIDQIAADQPDLKELVLHISKLSASVEQLPFERFREPVALLEQTEKGRNTILNLNSSYLKSWSQHMAYSMRVRMRSFEPALLAEIARNRPLPAQVLLRSHLEAAAMAALCVQTVQEAKGTANWAELRQLIPKTLFGTALFQKAKKDERLLEVLSLAEQRTITISSAIDALDTFTFGDKASGQLSWLYGLLCESSHQNHRGTRGFARSEPMDDSGEYGWEIHYTAYESVEPPLIERLLETLLISMQQGYAATELLRAMQFAEEDGRTVYRGVPKNVLARIWTEFLQRDAKLRAT